MPVLEKSSGERIIPDPGVYTAHLLKSIDMGSRHNEKYDKDERKLRLTFELDETYEFEEGDPKPFLIDREFTYKFSEKSALGKFIAAWMGQKFKDLPDQLELTDLFDIPCQLQIVHNENEGNTYANIDSVMPLGKGQKPVDRVNDTIVFDLDEFDEEVYDGFPEWMQDIISASPEYKEATKQKAKKAPAKPKKKAQVEETDEDDEDVDSLLD